MDADLLRACSPDELDDAITQMHAALGAVHQSLLELISIYDESKDWKAQGAYSIQGWVSFRLGVSMPLATAWVKAARALAGLPLIREAYAQGRISWEHVAALIEVATPSSEPELLAQAVAMSASHFKRLVRSLKQPTDLEAQEAIEQRSLCYHWDNAGRFLLLNGRLPDIDGAVVAKALDRLSEKLGPDPLTGQYSSINQNNADALVELASTYLETEADQDRATVVVHMDAQVLKGEAGMAEIEDAGPISVATARRICCDSLTELVVEGPDRKPLGVGRKTRQVPGWLMRQLRRRDHCCRLHPEPVGSRPPHQTLGGRRGHRQGESHSAVRPPSPAGSRGWVADPGASRRLPSVRTSGRTDDHWASARAPGGAQEQLV